MKQMLFIMNPVSGQKRAAKYLPEIIAMFNNAGYEVTAYMTAGSGDAARIAADRAQGKDIVVCCGGDGTLNETITGLLSAGLDVPIIRISSLKVNFYFQSRAINCSLKRSMRFKQ